MDSQLLGPPGHLQLLGPSWLLQQLELVNQVRKLLLKDDIHTRIETYIMEDSPLFESIKTLSTKRSKKEFAFRYHKDISH